MWPSTGCDGPRWLSRLSFQANIADDSFRNRGRPIPCLPIVTIRFCCGPTLRDGAALEQGPRLDARALRRIHARGDEDRVLGRATSSPTSIPASTPRATCARGRSRRSCARSCARSSAPTWFARREAGSLLRELWELGEGDDRRRAHPRGDGRGARPGARSSSASGRPST